MNETTVAPNYFITLVAGREFGPATHSLAAAADLAGLPAELLRYYCRIGLCGEARSCSATELTFDDDALYELIVLERYRRRHGLDRPTLRLLGGLQREIERLETEVRFLRGS
jgi:hypothetical protein